MAKLKAKTRRKLPATAFAYPGKRAYPIHDKSHARAALSRSASKKTSGTYSHVAAAVNRRYPGMAKGRKRKGAGRRKARRRR